MRPIAALILPLAAWAQSAQIAGIVFDPAGASIASVNVMLVQQETGIRRTTVTNTRGIYAVTSLRPGTYRIQLRKSGFQTVVRQDVSLDVTEHRRVDFELPLGDTREVVTVYGDASVVGSAEAGLGMFVPKKLVENLPVNGRGLLALLDIAPGVLTVPVRGADIGQFSVNGQRSSSNYITVDGVTSNFGVSNSGADSMAGGAAPALSAIGSMHTVISLEALEDFRLVTSTAGPEFGRFSGGQVVLQSRSGTNRWRGSAFVVARNEALDANDWFLNSTAQPKAPLRWWEGGGTVGGPIRRNRTFVFVSVDSFTLRQSQSVLSVVPSLALRQSAPAVVKPLANLYQVPNIGQPQSGTGQFLGSTQRQDNLVALSARWDHEFRPGLDAFVRYQRSPSMYRLDTAAFPRQDTQHYGLDQLTAGFNITHTPHAQQEVRVQFGGGRFVQESRITAPAALDLSAFLPPVTGTVFTLIQETIGPFGGLQQGALPARSQQQWNATDTLSVLRGNHLWRFGGDWRRLRDANAGRGYAISGTYDDLNSLAARQPFGLGLGRQEPSSLRFSQASLFAQDAWKVNARFSLSGGLRWEWYGAPSAPGQSPLFALAADQQQLAPAGSPLWQPRGTNFAPRVGAAWRVDRAGAWMVRGGVGLYYDSGNSGLFSVLIGQPPFGTTARTLFSFNGPIDPAAIVLPPASVRPPFGTFSAFAPDFQPPHVWQGNLTVEHMLPGRGLVATSWLASAGRDLVRRESGPVSSPDFTVLDLLTNYGRSDYQAFQIEFRQRGFRGLEALSTYTWSHSLDNSSRDTEIMLRGAREIDRGNSAFDVRQSFTASFSYDPPYWKGWGLDGIVRAHSGFPLEMTSGLGSGGLETAYRPDRVGSLPVWISDPHAPAGKALNPAAFTAPGQRQGTLGRNVIPGFGFAGVDTALRREFRWGDRAGVQLRVEAFNLLNHPNFGNPVGATPLPAFGRAASLLNTYLASGTLFGLPNSGASSGLVRDLQIGGPRVLQLQLRFSF